MVIGKWFCWGSLVCVVKSVYLFGCLGSSLWSGTLYCSTQASLQLGHSGSVVVAHRLSCHGMRDLNSPARNLTLVSCLGRQILNHRITREVPVNGLLDQGFLFRIFFDLSLVTSFIMICACAWAESLQSRLTL